ncbi:hypothetical protein MJO28_006949 [Puccinia striiformis f. sp. tritici]|uniref:DASH complex subunit DAD1 n=4 Tax=Puccinia striiformis TaxID=27350 RepID=A0A0L0VH11_9BASI|nr:hypothetical protein Pst134EA_013063 [Puccinia striiformis f. sp. tritici]KAI9621966.1 hypothetical protein H4Q26_015403 [Puccinia striiformis f. sp. tritici PST-130]KNE98496.1 hypothetical protein PSTG_08235 [Puccinia striiformis f. sp. tritici PST-78]POW13756.1 hypothetical protein PSTT_03476 [Puccinia striiformis]KAH9465170.1 hypothetical protein Pst134EA_013063 [Puccinia striiformis f. sp. tritici]KAI7951265.1 hypothetical protein MJO28_006949 [Puccinia striiformis f. sp. tritici]
MDEDSDEQFPDGLEDHTQFDNERLKWIAEIAESIGRYSTHLNALNRNIESLNLVGKQFENVNSLWSKFEQVISKPTAMQSGSTSTSPSQLTDQQSNQKLVTSSSKLSK